MVAADMTYDEMHARSGIEIAVLQLWEAYFYDVRPLRQATCWLAQQVVEPEIKAGRPQLAAQLRLAIMAGPIAVRSLLDMQNGVCLDEADRLFQRKLILQEKFEIASNLPLDSEKQQMFFLKTHVNILAAEKRQALAEQKLAQRCAEARDRFELRKLRLAQVAELRALKQSNRQRQAEQRAARRALAQRQAAQKVAAYDAQAALQALQCREAAGPLAQLRWSPQPLDPFASESAAANIEAQLVVVVKAWEPSAEARERCVPVPPSVLPREAAHEPMLAGV